MNNNGQSHEIKKIILLVEQYLCPALLLDEYGSVIYKNNPFTETISAPDHLLKEHILGHVKTLSNTQSHSENDLCIQMLVDQPFISQINNINIQWITIQNHLKDKSSIYLLLAHPLKDTNILVEESLTNILIDNVPAQIFWKDTNLVYLGCNQEFVKSLKLTSKNDVIGKNDFELPVSKSNSEKFRKDDQCVISSKKPKLNIEEQQTLKNGEIKHLLTSKVPLFNTNGDVIGVLAVYTDITKLKQLQVDLNIEKNKAEVANLAKTEFMENMRHDIRTPLTGIVGFSDLIKSEAKTPNIIEYADNLVASTHALLHLMDEVLEAIRVSSGEISKSEKKFSLEKTLQHVIDLNKAKAASKRLSYTMEFDDNIPKYVLGDNIRIHRIALELITNALNFTDSGFVKLTAKLAKKESRQIIVKLIIEDSGIGIPKEKQDDIFLQFKRLSPSHQGIYKGAGLGLAVIKQFIDDLDGEIYVESAKRQGSTFTCVIPFKKPLLLDDEEGVDDVFDSKTLSPETGASPQSILATIDNTTEGGVHKILVVEDNHIAQAIAKSMLKQFECLVDVAEDGKKALELWKQFDYDLIFMDIGLPDMDGYDVTHHIRVQELAKKSHTPIIALTAHAGEEYKQRCIEAGMNAVLIKPLTQVKCKDILDSFIPSKRHRKNIQTNKYASDLPEQSEKLFQLAEYPLLDTDEGLKATGTSEMLTQMLTLMIEQALPEDMAKMKEAHNQGDWEKAQDISHKIKSGALYVGAIRLKMACQYFERYWKNGEQELLEQLYQQVLTTIEESITEIYNWLKNQ